MYHLQFDRRPETESELAVRVARTFGLTPDVSGTDLTLDEVGRAIRTATQPGGTGAAMPVCFVEHIEQLLLQTVGGLDLLDRMLTLISRTDAHVFWVGTMATSAWQLVEKRLPAASELVTHRRLAPLSREALEELVMSRHRRSGLTLHFESEEETTSLHAPQRQADRREAFFDQLHEASHQNVALALLYWLRSVEPQEDENGLRVKPLRPLSFRVLDELTLEQAFALKAFLIHSTLTVEEYSRVARVSVADGADIIESLGNASLIEPVEPPPERKSDVYFEAVSPTVPYRIRPLLVAPIIDRLEADNIVH